jgi:hypothetical protein
MAQKGYYLDYRGDQRLDYLFLAQTAPRVEQYYTY